MPYRLGKADKHALQIEVLLLHGRSIAHVQGQVAASFYTISVMETIPNFKDIQHLRLVFKTNIQVTARKMQVVHHLTSNEVHISSHFTNLT